MPLVFPKTAVEHAFVDRISKSTFLITDIVWKVKEEDQLRTDLPTVIEMGIDLVVTKKNHEKLFRATVLNLQREFDAKIEDCDVAVLNFDGGKR